MVGFMEVNAGRRRHPIEGRGAGASLRSLSTTKIYTNTLIVQNTVHLLLIHYCKYLLVDMYKLLSRTLALGFLGCITTVDQSLRVCPRKRPARQKARSTSWSVDLMAEDKYKGVVGQVRSARRAFASFRELSRAFASFREDCDVAESLASICNDTRSSPLPLIAHHYYYH